MASWKQGDRLPALKAVAYNESALVDLTQFSTITFRAVSGSAVITGTAIGDASGNLTYNWGASDTAVPGTYSAYFIATDPTGKVATFPGGDNLTFTIMPPI